MSQPLLEQLCSRDTLQAATDWLQSESPQYNPDLGALAAKLESGDYCFQPLTTVEKTNKLGEAETLEVWESQDRLVLKAMSLVLKDHLSKDFPTCCHHLEGRGGIKKAVRKTREFIQNNPDSWVLKIDVKGYYAHIDHVVLYNQLQSLIPNEQYILRLTWQYLKRTINDGGNYYDRELGISLGCPLSPLMAALYLQTLDAAFEGQEWFYARFMDDWVVITPTRWKLRSAEETVNVILNQHKLGKANDKTFIGRSLAGFDFVGYHFTPESLTVGKISLQRRDARIHRLYEQGAGEHRIGGYVSRWQQWAKAGLQGQLTETKEFNNIPRQADSSKLPLEAKFLALGVASVLSTAAFDSHATVYHLATATSAGCAPVPRCASWGPPTPVGIEITLVANAGFRLQAWAAYKASFSCLGGANNMTPTSQVATRILGLGTNTGQAITLFNSAPNPVVKFITCSSCSEPKVLWWRLTSPAVTTYAPPPATLTAGWANSSDTVDVNTTDPCAVNSGCTISAPCPSPNPTPTPVKSSIYRVDAANPITTLALVIGLGAGGMAISRRRKPKVQDDDTPLE